MAEPTTGKLQVVVVTPERAVLDEAADTAVVPMYDGELGVLPNRAPLVGRLGPGELRLTSGTNTKRFFVEDGFVQIGLNAAKQTLITVLTARATKAEDLTPAGATEALATADAMPVTNQLERESKTRAQVRARSMARVAARNG